MSKIAVIGVGDVGSTLAYTLELSGLATEITLIDINKKTAKGHALDMNHGLFFTPPVKIYAGDYSDCKGAKVIVFAAGARQKKDETRLELVQRNAKICESIVKEIKPYVKDAILLITTNPVDVMTYTVLKKSKLSYNQVLGSGTVLDSARFRYTLSQKCGVDARNVHAYVIGEHGDSEVFLWSSVNISGIPLKSLCKGCQNECNGVIYSQIEETVKKSAYHIIEAKGFTNYGVSLAVLRILGAILRNENSILTVSTFLNDKYGLRDVCLSVPCLVNSKGVERVIEAPLSSDESKDLKNSGEVLKAVIKELDQL
jgi:L-lactate dehydrogenase